jgi:arginine exporter protein ArgO
VVHRRRWRIYLQFVGLTLLNPLTVAYFASLILGGGGDGLATAWDRSVFVLGAALASFTWQTLLAIGGAVLRRGFPPRLQAGLGILGNVIILGLGLQILFGGIAGRF